MLFPGKSRFQNITKFNFVNKKRREKILSVYEKKNAQVLVTNHGTSAHTYMEIILKMHAKCHDYGMLSFTTG